MRESLEKIVRLGVDPSIDTSIIPPSDYQHGMLGRRIVDENGDKCYENVCFIKSFGWISETMARKNWDTYCLRDQRLLVSIR